MILCVEEYELIKAKRSNHDKKIKKTNQQKSCIFVTLLTTNYTQMKKYLLVIGIIFPMILASCQQKNTSTGPQNWQWRGENRNGMYLNETGLLKEWAADGPELLWHFDGIGEGHTSVAISNQKIYINGMHDDRLMIYEFDMKGKLLREKEIGKEWDIDWNGTRSSICINEGKLYIFNALGTLYCIDQITFNEVWKIDFLAEYGGRNLRHGMSENPLIVGDKLFMTPGGIEHNMVALNKNTGELIWSSPGNGEISSYCSPLYIEGYSVPIIVTNMNEHIIAFNADTGEMLWKYPQQRSWAGNNPNIPIYSDGVIFTTSGYGAGSMTLRLTNGGRDVEPVWKNEVDNLFGSAIKSGDYIYLSGQQSARGWHCVDWRTGEIKYRVDDGNCSVVYADGMLYMYSDRGFMNLVKPNPEEYELVSSFEVTLGTDQHWAHPVIHDGVLYIRRGNTLMAYKI